LEKCPRKGDKRKGSFWMAADFAVGWSLGMKTDRLVEGVGQGG